MTSISWDRRKEDAGVGVTSLKIATRAAESNLNADQTFELSPNANENCVRSDDFGNAKLISKVRKLLRIAVLDDIENAKFIEGLVDTEFPGSMDTLKTFGLYNPEQPQEGDVPAPTPEQAKEILASQVTTEQMEVIRKMEKPALQLIPVTSMFRYMTALNSYKPMDAQIDARCTDWYEEVFAGADERDGVKDDDTIVGWKIAVTEGSKEPKLLHGDDMEKTLKERDAWFKQEFAGKGISGVDLKRMIVLMMDSLKNGEPVNDYFKEDGTSTFVNEEPEKYGLVPRIKWADRHHCIDMSDFDADVEDDFARFRASVVVDVPKAA